MDADQTKVPTMNEYRRLSRKQWAWTTATATLLAAVAGGITFAFYRPRCVAKHYWPQYEAWAILQPVSTYVWPYERYNARVEVPSLEEIEDLLFVKNLPGQ